MQRRAQGSIPAPCPPSPILQPHPHTHPHVPAHLSHLAGSSQCLLSTGVCVFVSVCGFWCPCGPSLQLTHPNPATQCRAGRKSQSRRPDGARPGICPRKQHSLGTPAIANPATENFFPQTMLQDNLREGKLVGFVATMESLFVVYADHVHVCGAVRVAVL